MVAPAGADCNCSWSMIMNKPASGEIPGARERLPDLLASLVVFLVALPLYLGIAIACGVPPALGLVTGIIGGLVTSTLAGCRLQVSGPAAGPTVLVFDLVQRHGLAALGVVVLFAGLLQVVAGLLKSGKWFRAVSPAVLHGMLAGIGVLLCASQFHVMFDYKPQASGLPNLLSIPSAVFDTVKAQGGASHLLAGYFPWTSDPCRIAGLADVSFSGQGRALRCSCRQHYIVCANRACA